MNLLAKMERKYGKYAIRNLMLYMIAGYAVVWIIINFAGNVFLKYLTPDISLILKGQVWRLLTLIFLPPEYGNILFLAINLYFLYFIAQIIEATWGSFSLNLFFLVGVLLHIIGAFVMYFAFDINVGSISGISTGSFMYGSYYLTMALFLLSGMIAPNVTVLLFFIIPLKMRWLAMFTMALLAGTVLFGYGYWYGLFTNMSIFRGLLQIGIYPAFIPATSALLSVLTFFLMYFLMRHSRVSRVQKARKKEFAKKMRVAVTDKPKIHKCAVCGRTSEDETLSFRYCSKCNGMYEYCQDHLFTHEHKK